MRFQVNQTLFAVHFGFASDSRQYGWFRQPLLYTDDMPTDINFTKLTVTEHHKVHSEWENDKEGKEPGHDGYLLKDEKGIPFANQYPRASYGQLSDEADRRFRMHITEEGALTKQLEEDPKTIFDYHLLSDVLRKIQQGIKDLGEVKLTDANKDAVRKKRDLLIALYDRIVKEFHEKYPDYQLILAWKPLYSGSKLLWPRISYRKRISLEKARALSKEEILKELAGYMACDNIAYEVELPSSDRLVIEHAEGNYYLDETRTDVKTINVFFLEKAEEGPDDKPSFYVCQLEYFPVNWEELAVESFLKRIHSDSPFKASGLGMSIEAVYAKYKAEHGKDDMVAEVRHTKS